MKFLKFLISVLLLMIFLLVLNINKIQGQISTKHMPYPLTISAMREKNYPGSEIKIEQVLELGDKYNSYIASYKSERFTIYGLLTIPSGSMPEGGWPAIIFNHGYIAPEEYQTTERYTAYVDAFASHDYVVFKPDFRGHGNSHGVPESPYYSPAYTEDVLNAISSIKNLKKDDNIINPEKIGMWGHSMGGNITLRSLVISKEIKAAVIWAGVVGNYEEILYKWPNSVPTSAKERSNKNHMLNRYGTPMTNPVFWDSIDPTNYLADISAPVQLHHAQNDEDVPVQFSVALKNRLLKAGKSVQLYVYQDGGHNISPPSFDQAMSRSIAFFDQYLK